MKIIHSTFAQADEFKKFFLASRVSLKLLCASGTGFILIL